MNLTTNTLTHDKTIDGLLSDLTGPWGVDDAADGVWLTYRGVLRRQFDSACDAKDIAKTLNRHHPPARTLTGETARAVLAAFGADRLPRRTVPTPTEFASAMADAMRRPDVAGQIGLYDSGPEVA